MHWNDHGIILSIQKFDEQGAVIRMLTQDHGLHAGVDKYALSSKRRGIYQVGNRIEVEWKARLSEHLGSFRSELIEPVASYLIDDVLKLTALQSACSITEKLIVERDPHPEIHAALWELLCALKSPQSGLDAYVLYELNLLRMLGFGLDLSRCAATGSAQDLHYVSPRTGRAVSVEGAQGYENRLLKLPSFLLFNSPHGSQVLARSPASGEQRKSVPSSAEILDGLRLCGYFLEQRAFSVKGAAMPVARELLYQRCVTRISLREKPVEKVLEHQGG